ncbi:MAG: cation diffusion facilitator family transporter [Acidobacteriota bacterium]|nr:cation diffusion facilitator family transporter [Acidobacteriota bacterium]
MQELRTLGDGSAVSGGSAVQLKQEFYFTHSHSHVPSTGKVLSWSLVATLLFVAVEVTAGLKAGSLALLSDAGHNATDALALLLAWVGVWFQDKPADHVKTFGYQRAGVLVAFVNALTLVLLSGWIFWEGYERLLHPEPVMPLVMIGVAGLGLLLNGGIMFGLNAARRTDINIRSAFVHMLGDLLGSAAIVIGGIAIYFSHVLQIDTVLSLVIAALIVYTAWDIIKESMNILLEGLPRGIELSELVRELGLVEGVLEVHDLHVWSLGSNSRAMSCHVVIDDVPPSESNCVLERINHVLDHKFRIGHTTVQFEHVGCVVSRKGCVIAVDAAHSHAHHTH